LSKNPKETQQVSLAKTLQSLEARIEEIEARVDDLSEKLDKVQRGRAYSPRGAPSSQVRILKYMQESSEGSTMKEIQNETGLAKATVSTGLKDLMNIGSVQKIPSLKKDARYKYVVTRKIPDEIRKMLELLDK
jgi:Fic family protein